MDNRPGSDLVYCRECGGVERVARILKPPAPGYLLETSTGALLQRAGVYTVLVWRDIPSGWWRCRCS